jgi:hypothetical protein
MATRTTRMLRRRLPILSQARLLVRTCPRVHIMARVRPWDHPCMAGMLCPALQRLKRPQQPVLAAAIRYLLHCLELEVTGGGE